MKKKMISSLIILCLLFTAPGISGLAADKGSTPSSWAVAEIEKAKEYGLVTAKVLGNYLQSITREEFCELAVKLYEALSGNAAPLPASNRFTDTSNPEILKANALGIVNGVNAEQTLFDPKSNVNREQIAVMFYRTLQAVDNTLIKGSYFINFRDANLISSWAQDAVCFMAGNDIITGIGNNMLSPQGPATREQGIALVKRTYEKFRSPSEPPPVLYIPPVIQEPEVIQASMQNGYEIYQEINPEKGTTTVVADSISVTVPAINLSESKILSVKEANDVKPAEGLNFIKAYDIQLGGQREFRSPLEIEIPVPESRVYGAFYYNPATGAWEEVPFAMGRGRSIIIKTNHLSQFGVAEVKNNDYTDPMRKIVYYYPDFYRLDAVDPSSISQMSPAQMEALAMNKGWDAAKQWFDLLAVGSEIADGILPGFENLNKAIGKMGNAANVVQLFLDIHSGKHVNAAAGAYEMAIGSWVGYFGEAGAGIGLLGASIINMSIKEFAQTAITSKESQYEKAYAYYYDRNKSLNRKISIRDDKGWYDAFYNIIETSPKYLNERINADIERYVRAIWDDLELLTAQGIIGQQGKSSTITGGGAYLNEDLMERLSNNYASMLSGSLKLILKQVIEDYEWNERQKFKKEYGDKVVSELNREYTVRVKVESHDGLQVTAGFESGNTRWQGLTDHEGNWEFRFTLLGYLYAGAPKKIFARDGMGNYITQDFNLEMSDVVLGETNTFDIHCPETVQVGEFFELRIEKNGEPYDRVEISSANPVLPFVYEANQRKGYCVPSQPGTYELQVRDMNNDRVYTVPITVEESELSLKAKNDIARYDFGTTYEPPDYSSMYMVDSAYGQNYQPEFFVTFQERIPGKVDHSYIRVHYEHRDYWNITHRAIPSVDEVNLNDYVVKSATRYEP
jgi:hypothetical protein